MEIDSHQMKITPKMTTKKGGLRTMPFIIANEAFEKVAGVGLHVNMILYLIHEYHLSSATGQSVLFLWNAVSNFLPIFGAFLSDSYLGRFRVIALGTFVSLLGLITLWLTAMIPEARPPHCKPQVETCVSAKPAQLILLYSSFALMSIGSGGVRPCSLAFGADQFDNPHNPKNERILQSFFNWYYASVGISIMLSVTVIVYIMDRAGWKVGFGVPVGLMLFSTVMFLLGSSLYVKVKANKSLFTGFALVVSASWKKRSMPLSVMESGNWYYKKGSKLTEPTAKLRFLNRACIIVNPDKDLNPDGSPTDPWNLCTVRQVEELKALIKVLPIWSTGITIAIISQQAFPVLQASTMDRHIFHKNLQIPPASFVVFTFTTLTIWVAIYDRILVPLLSKFTKNKKGLTLKQRMGIGLAISCLTSAVGALVEKKRRNAAFQISAMWLAPQYCLIGLAEAFNAIGQIEFYYSQFPKSMTSIVVGLFALGMGVGNLVGSLLVTILSKVTTTGGRVSWLADDLNQGHYDYYYWVLCLMSVVNFLYYLGCSWAYGSCGDIKDWDDDEGKLVKENGEELIIGDPIMGHRV